MKILGLRGKEYKKYFLIDGECYYLVNEKKLNSICSLSYGGKDCRRYMRWVYDRFQHWKRWKNFNLQPDWAKIIHFKTMQIQNLTRCIFWIQNLTRRKTYNLKSHALCFFLSIQNSTSCKTFISKSEAWYFFQFKIWHVVKVLVQNLTYFFFQNVTCPEMFNSVSNAL